MGSSNLFDIQPDTLDKAGRNLEDAP